jgi:hypothetical protein
MKKYFSLSIQENIKNRAVAIKFDLDWFETKMMSQTNFATFVYYNPPSSLCNINHKLY